MNRSNVFWCCAPLVLALALVPSLSLAWGVTGHRDVNAVAMGALPSDLPPFLSTSAAIATVEVLGPEEDTLKDAGYSWDHDGDPGHYLDLRDDQTIAGVVYLHRLPSDMETYAAALRAAGTDPYRVGYLPYSIADGWERLRKEFAYWRVLDYLSRRPGTAATLGRIRMELALRQDLIVHDIGIWGHFVGDGSQPLHVTVHDNGWGHYPNPHHYTHHPIHAEFESTFVSAHVREAAVAALVPPGGPRDPGHLLSQSEILQTVGDYLEHTWTEVPVLYAVEKRGGFTSVSPEAVEFATARIADGARELRDLVVLAWDDSAYETVGYPAVRVSDILAGRAKPSTVEIVAP